MGKRGPSKQFPHQVWVQMTDEQHDWLRRESALTGTSVSDLIRYAINDRIASEAAS